MFQLLVKCLLLFPISLAFAASQDGRWHAGIGDASIFGWVTVTLYLAAVVRCLARAKDSKQFGGNYQFWLYLGAFLLLLGINKQLDLQSWLTELVKDSAQANGWYERRKPVQIFFIVALGLAMLIALLSLRLFLANSWRHHKIAWLGIMLLCAFILIRAASFHHFDIFIDQPVLGIRINVIIEISAILLIILGTLFNKKSANLLNTNTFPMNQYAEIVKAGDDIQCPQCGVQPLANTKDGRVFKCRACGNKFIVRVLTS